MTTTINYKAMTEEEYILIRDLGRIDDAKKILRDLLPITSSIVTKEDYAKVFQILTKWEFEHQDAIYLIKNDNNNKS